MIYIDTDDNDIDAVYDEISNIINRDSSDWLPFGGTTWAVISNYTNKTNPISKKVIDNHCGATVAINIALYFANRDYTKLKKNGSIKDTFYDLHNRTGNGPVAMIAGKLEAQQRGR